MKPTIEQVDAAIKTMPKITEFDGRFDSAAKLRDDVMSWHGQNTETALFALRFLRLAMGEPDDALALEPFKNKSLYKASERKRVFKAMRDKLLEKAAD